MTQVLTNLNEAAFFAGTTHRTLAESVITWLNMLTASPTAEDTIALSGLHLSRFSDGEIDLRIRDNVRGKDVYVFQTTPPPADNFLELLLLCDALRRSSIGRLTAIIPYLGYSRQDRRVRSSRVPISARIIADMLVGAGIDRLVTVELHAEQIQGFYSIPVDNIYATRPFVSDIRSKKLSNGDLCIVSPDIGGVVRARAYAKQLDCDLVIIDKRRDRANESEVMHVIGETEGKHCIIVDDIVDTAGTLCNAAAELKKRGAIHVSAYCTHPVLSGNALKNINAADLDELVVTDTLPLSPEATKCGKIRSISLAEVLGDSIYRIHNAQSLSALFPDK